MKIFIICPVRNITFEERLLLHRYVSELETRGHQVYWPLRDTNQQDICGGLCTVRENLRAMKQADQVHIWWNGRSEGSLADFHMALALDKKAVLINPDLVQKLISKEIKRGITKSYNRVVWEYTAWSRPYSIARWERFLSKCSPNFTGAVLVKNWKDILGRGHNSCQCCESINFTLHAELAALLSIISSKIRREKAILQLQRKGNSSKEVISTIFTRKELALIKGSMLVVSGDYICQDCIFLTKACGVRGVVVDKIFSPSKE